MGKPGHDFTVKIFLTADQFIALQHEAQNNDVSQSSFVRRLLVDYFNAQAKQYAGRRSTDTPEPEQE